MDLGYWKYKKIKDGWGGVKPVSSYSFSSVQN